MSRQWFVGRFQYGKHKIATENLERQGFEVYLPMYISEWGRFARAKPFLYQYLFVALDLEKEAWKFRLVENTRGMYSSDRPGGGAILITGEKPRAISDWVIQGIKDREVNGFVKLPPRIRCSFSRGDRVSIKGSIIEAIFDEVKDERRAWVFIDLLTKRHKLEVPINKIIPPHIAAVV